jgi:hypothetical protein
MRRKSRAKRGLKGNARLRAETVDAVRGLHRIGVGVLGREALPADPR